MSARATRLTRAEALKAIAQSSEVHVSIDVFEVGDYVRVTKHEARELLARRLFLKATDTVTVTITHAGKKMWLEPRDGAALVKLHRVTARLLTHVTLTEEDIAVAGVVFPFDTSEGDSARALAWVKAQPALRYSEAVGIYAVAPDGEKLVAPAEDEYHFAQWRGLTGRRFVRFNAATLNTLAQAVGRPPLDVLAEIAKT